MDRAINSINARPVDLYHQSKLEEFNRNKGNQTTSNMEKYKREIEADLSERRDKSSPKRLFMYDAERYPYKMGNNGWKAYEETNDLKPRDQIRNYANKFDHFERSR